MAFARPIRDSLSANGGDWVSLSAYTKSALTSSCDCFGAWAAERLHGEFRCRVKTQCALPSSETAAMLFWAVMALLQITLRRVDGWQTLDQMADKQAIDLAA